METHDTLTVGWLAAEASDDAGLVDQLSKEFLKAWYGRRGYRIARTGRVDDAYPQLAPLLATACDLEVHEKPLAA
jgi:hypothetical protein